MTARPRREVSDADVAALLAVYRHIEAQIAEYQEDIRGLEHSQALIIRMMNDAGLTYREIGPLIGRGHSRVHQIAETLKP